MTHKILSSASLVLGLALAACSDDTTAPESPEASSTTTPALAAGSAALTFRQVSAGMSHSCGVTTNDAAYCWGTNGAGQLGTGSTTGPETCTYGDPCSTRPVAVTGGLRFRAVSVGDGYTCGVTTENRAFCWGDNSWGTLGTGTQTPSSRPVAVAGTRRYRQITANTFHTCAVTPFDKAFCWGNNNWGQLGDGTTIDRLSPVAVKVGTVVFTQLAAGGTHTCGMATNARAYCWGDNEQGQLGDRTRTDRLTPVPVFGGLAFRNVTAGRAHTCGVTTGSRGYCWGNNQQGQVGDGTDYLRRLRPTPATGGLQFKLADAGSNQTCALTTGDRAYCWGALEEPWATPRQISSTLRFTQLEAGGHACAVTSAGEAYCWGGFFGNDSGQLGNGTMTDSSTPTKVVGPA